MCAALHKSTAARPPPPPVSLERQLAQAVPGADVDSAVALVRSAPGSLSRDSLSSLLYLFCETAPQRHQEALLLANAHAALIADDDERLLSLLVRLHCCAGDVDKAARTVARVARMPGAKLKLRTVAPLIELCATAGSAAAVSTGLHLLQLCRNRGVPLSPLDVAHFTTLLCNAAKQRDGGLLGDAALADVEAEVNKMLRSLADHHPVLQSDAELVAVGATLSQIGFAPMTRSCIDPATATCSSCGLRLSAAAVTRDDLALLHRSVESVLLQDAISRKPDRANAIRASFATFKARVARADFDVVVDGANLGFYGLSGRAAAGAGGFDYGFLALAVREMEATLKLRPLIVLHERHLEPHNVAAAADSKSAAATLDSWRRRQIVIATARGLNDDIVTLHALTAPRSGGHASAVFQLSNDLMRDHLFQILSTTNDKGSDALARAFRRLCCRRTITFSASFDKELRQTRFHPRLPLPYSVFLQRSSGSDAGGVSCHVPMVDRQDPPPPQDDDDASSPPPPPIKWFCFRKR